MYPLLPSKKSCISTVDLVTKARHYKCILMLQLIHFGNYQLSGGVFFQDLLVVNLVFFKIIYDCYKHTDSSTESYSRKSPRRIQNSLSNIVGGTFLRK